jgi:phosphinothricin acetyltransferase
MQPRVATLQDAEAIARIYNQGIEDRATFETRLRSADDVRHWFDGSHPVVVVEDKAQIVAFGATFPYRPNRDCYAGVAELSIYTAREARCRGAGRLAIQALLRAAEQAGFWMLLSRVFPENTASRMLLRSCGEDTPASLIPTGDSAQRGLPCNTIKVTAKGSGVSLQGPVSKAISDKGIKINKQ